AGSSRLRRVGASRVEVGAHGSAWRMALAASGQSNCVLRERYPLLGTANPLPPTDAGGVRG
ncbi:MAG: hypothetical protein ACYCTZ_15065, partial [Candidatus Dormibacteria bacterium]